MRWFRNLKIANKLMLVVSAVLGLTVLLGILSIQKLKAVNADAKDMSTTWLPSVQALGKMTDITSDFRGAELQLVLASDKQDMNHWEGEMALLLEELRKTEARYEPLISSPAERSLYSQFQQDWNDCMAEHQKIVELARANKNSGAIALVQGLARQKYDRMNTILNQAIALNSGNVEDAARQGQYTYESALQQVILVLITALLVGLLLAQFVARLIGKSIRRIVDTLHVVQSGDFTERLDMETQDEIGHMGKALNETLDKVSATLQAIGQNSQALASSSEELAAVSQQMSSNAEETSAQSGVVSAAAEQVTKNLHAVATATGQMTSSIKEIAKNANDAAKVANSAVKTAESTTATVAKLGQASNEIGQVIKVITSIAQQTNLLALNATIEAARAGEAGKGFAVVANEVKELAKETAKATEDITQKIEGVQTDTKGAVEAIAQISYVIAQINDISNTIASAVEEQTATTNEIARNVAEAARGGQQVAENITSVAHAARDTSSGAANTQTASGELSHMAADLQKLVGQFKYEGAEAHAGGANATRRKVA